MMFRHHTVQHRVLVLSAELTVASRLGGAQPNDTSNHTMVKVNLALASVCLAAMLGIEAKCLWRVYCCWRANQIWFALRSTTVCTSLLLAYKAQKLLSLLLQHQQTLCESLVRYCHASVPTKQRLPEICMHAAHTESSATGGRKLRRRRATMFFHAEALTQVLVSSCAPAAAAVQSVGPARTSTMVQLSVRCARHARLCSQPSAPLPPPVCLRHQQLPSALSIGPAQLKVC